MNLLRNMVSRATVAMTNAAAKMQALQLRLYAGEVRDAVEHFENYGITVRPLNGAEAVVLSVGGDRSSSVAICVADRRYRPTDLAPGEVCIYTHEGDRITLRNGRKIEVETLTLVANAENSTTINSPSMSLNGDVAISGHLDVGAGAAVEGPLTNNGVSVGSGHTHKNDGKGTPV